MSLGHWRTEMVPVEYLLNFLKEDTPFGDITSESVVPDVDCRAVITVEEPAVIAGVAEAGALFRHYGITVECAAADGAPVEQGDVILTVSGNARKILTIERTALNIIGRMSGVATMTRRFVSIVQNVRPGCRIAATRKTCPGFRLLDKKAVSLGGGDPHRWSLSDGILIKDNHLSFTSIPEAVAHARERSLYQRIEVEVSTVEDAMLAARAGADIIMLDNMTPDAVGNVVKTLTREGLRDRVTIEVSGGIDEDTLARYAVCGTDVISIGALTHSVRNISVHLDIVKTDPGKTQ